MRLIRPLLSRNLTSLRPSTSPSLLLRAQPSHLHLHQQQHLRQNHTPSHPTPSFSSNVSDPSAALTSLSTLLQTPDPPNNNHNHNHTGASTSTSTSTTSSSTSKNEAVVEGKKSGKWTLTPSRAGLQRTYHFKTFAQAWGFMCTVAERCKVERHHPEWFNCYNEVKITWTTHRPKGLSEKDILMARFCDEKAGEMGAKD